MTSLTYMTYAFVFVFLNVMRPSEEMCMDYLELDKWKENKLAEHFDVVITEDPKDQIICTYQRTCIQRPEDPTCIMLGECCGPDKSICENVANKTLPECENRSPVKVPFFHILCLISQQLHKTSKVCNYNHMLPKDKILPETPCSVSNPTTTQTTTTTITTPPPTTAITTTPTPPTTPPPTTTTTTPTTTAITTTPTATPTTTATATATTTTTAITTPPTTTTAITTTATPPTTATTTTAMIATPEPTAQPIGPSTTSHPNVSNLTATQNKTTLPEMSTTTTTTATATATPNARIASPTVLEAKNEDLQILLWVSLVFHVIMPVAVYLFMRHQWRRDKASYMYDGNTAENEHMVQVATPQALVNCNEHGAQSLQLVRDSDDDDDPRDNNSLLSLLLNGGMSSMSHLFLETKDSPLQTFSILKAITNWST